MSETKDWRKICADCKEGEPPKDCEYYGEPNGCNSPTYGMHPTCKDSLQVGNSAVMRKALNQARRVLHCAIVAGILKGEDAHKALNVVTAALAKPPRNCDKCLTPKDAMLAHLEEVYEGEKVEFGDYEWCEFVKWLFAEAKGETND